MTYSAIFYRNYRIDAISGNWDNNVQNVHLYRHKEQNIFNFSNNSYLFLYYKGRTHLELISVYSHVSTFYRSPWHRKCIIFYTKSVKLCEYAFSRFSINCKILLHLNDFKHASQTKLEKLFNHLPLWLPVILSRRIFIWCTRPYSSNIVLRSFSSMSWGTCPTNIFMLSGSGCSTLLLFIIL